jgi:hypothetical protein
MRVATMEWDIIDFSLLDGYKIRLTFTTGETGVVDLKPYTTRGGVFSRFIDIDYFRSVYVDSGVLTWPGGVDIAPETVYSMATGKPLPEWMEPDEQEVRVEKGGNE